MRPSVAGTPVLVKWFRVVASMLMLIVLIAADAQTSDSAHPDDVPDSSTFTGNTFRQADTVAVITIHGPVDRITDRSVTRRIKKAVDEGAQAIVLELDTPGGQLDVTLDICTLLKDRSITPANTVAWVNTDAYSAGTIIALACREIVVAPNATFGDAAPILVGPMGFIQLSPAERAKTEAPLLAEVVDSARRHGYDENLVRSFISVGVELWMLENKDTGERVFVDRLEYEEVFGEEPPVTMTPVAPPDDVDAIQNTPLPSYSFGRSPYPDVEPIDPEQARADAEEAIAQSQNLPPRDRLTSADRDEWELIGQVISDDQLLTVKPAEAMFYGLAQRVIANDEELKEFFGAQEIVRYNRSWSEDLARFLLSWPVRMVLIVIFILALVIELAAPGLGVFGVTALIALGLLIGTPALAGLAEWWDIAFIGGGVALILVELFLIPGFGVAGICGLLCLMLGLIGTFVSGDTMGSALNTGQLIRGFVVTVTGLFGAGIGVWLLSRQFHSMPILNRVILRDELKTPGGTAGSRPSLLEAMAGKVEEGPQVGDTGTTVTDLRPAGRADINGDMLDVNSVSGFVTRGASVRIVNVGRFTIDVEEVHE